MPKFVKKPVEVTAVKWTGGNIRAMEKFIRSAITFKVEGDELLIYTLEGIMTASKGDWIIRGVKNEYYPCKPDIFEETYEYAPSELSENAFKFKG